METLRHVTSVLAEIQTRNVTNISKKKILLEPNSMQLHFWNSILQSRVDDNNS